MAGAGGSLLNEWNSEDASAQEHQPANKAGIAASSLEVMSVPVVEGSTSEEVTLLATSLKTPGPGDLALQVTAECALWTDVTVVGNDESQAIATVRVWIEKDGVALPVSADDTADVGRVVFCNRDYRVVTTQFEDEDATIEQFLRTRQANAFTWFDIDAGSGTHEYVVKAQLEAEVTGTGFAKAAVGKRTFLAEPVHLANDATL